MCVWYFLFCLTLTIVTEYFLFPTNHDSTYTTKCLLLTRIFAIWLDAMYLASVAADKGTHYTWCFTAPACNGRQKQLTTLMCYRIRVFVALDTSSNYEAHRPHHPSGRVTRREAVRVHFMSHETSRCNEYDTRIIIIVGKDSAITASTCHLPTHETLYITTM